MNIYLVVEGKKTEPKVYPAWVKFINPELVFTNRLDDVKSNGVYIFSGNGYPAYLNVIKNAAKDMTSIKHENTEQCLFHRLVVAVDAEETTTSEKVCEIMDSIRGVTGGAHDFDCRVIVHNFCLETWFLANNKLYVNARQTMSRDYRSHYDVASLDPEKLILPVDSRWHTRSQYAFDYLRASIADRWPKQVYSKNNPGAVLHEKYFKAVKKRFDTTEDIRSLRMLFDAFTWA